MSFRIRVDQSVTTRDKDREIIIVNIMGLGSTELTVINDVVNSINEGKDDPASFVLFEKLLQEVGVFILRVSAEFILIYKGGDPSIERILKAKLEALPEFLSSEDEQDRLLAKWKLDALNNCMG